MRGEAYFVLAAFQKDGLKKAELSEQSMKLYSKLLEEIFKEEMIQQYVQRDDEPLLKLYSVIIHQTFQNYKIVIVAKVDYIMNLPSDSDEIKSRLKELNVLRRDFAVHMITLEKLAKIKPELYDSSLLLRVYRDIATQFRSIILNHPNNQQQNLNQSYSYLMRHAEACISRPELKNLFETYGKLSVSDLSIFIGMEIDQDPFIIKFRQA